MKRNLLPQLIFLSDSQLLTLRTIFFELHKIHLMIESDHDFDVSFNYPSPYSIYQDLQEIILEAQHNSNFIHSYRLTFLIAKIEFVCKNIVIGTDMALLEYYTFLVWSNFSLINIKLEYHSS